MSKKNKPKIKNYTKYPYTKITFYPDLQKFKMNKIGNSMYKLMEKRVYDICGLTNDSINQLNEVEIIYKAHKLSPITYKNISRLDLLLIDMGLSLMAFSVYLILKKFVFYAVRLE